MDSHWTATSIETQLQAVADSGERSTKAYVVGGGAMVIHGFRDRAPDIDLLVDSGEDLQLVDRALREAGFKSHKEMSGDDSTFRGMYRDEQYREIDVWADQLEAELDLRLTDGLITRSQSLVEGAALEFRVLSPEDLIVSKLLGERPKDLFDFRSLLGTDLDREIVKSEMIDQCEIQGREVPSTLFLGAFE